MIRSHKHSLLLLIIMFTSVGCIYAQQVSPNQVASLIGNSIRKHKNEWGENKGKKLFLRDQIDNDLDIRLRTLYKIPNRGTSVVAAFSYTPKLTDYLAEPFEAGIVFTNKGIHTRKITLEDGWFGVVRFISYSELYYDVYFEWDKNFVFFYRKSSEEKTPVAMLPLYFSDVDPPYLANLLESIGEYAVKELGL